MSERLRMELEPEKLFDGRAYYKEITAARKARKLRWHDVSVQTGVSLDTIQRLRQGREIRLNSYLILERWKNTPLPLPEMSEEELHKKWDELSAVEKSFILSRFTHSIGF